jgi:hypothetical protein
MKLSKMSGLLGLFALLVGFTATRVYALPANEVETFFFSDAAYENEVGYSVLACQGGFYREGRVGRYSVRLQTPCNGGNTPPSSPGIACYLDGRLGICPPNVCETWAEYCY